MDLFASATDLQRRGRSREAEAICEQMLMLPGERRKALTLLADIQLASGRTVAAIERLTELASLQPGDAANLRRLGGALLSSGRAADAADALRRAIELEPDNVRAHNNLGRALLQLGEVAQAIMCFNCALAANPDYAIAHHNRGLALILAGEPESAFEAFDRASALDPNCFDAFTASGVLLLRLNRAEAALARFDCALRLRPGDATALTRRASALLMLERPRDAIDAADAALRSRDDTVDAYLVKAGALCRCNRPADALRCLDRMLALNPGHVEGWCSRAVVHQQLGDDESSIDCYRRALHFDPDCLQARTGLISGLIPAVPLSKAESLGARAAFDRELSAFEHWLSGRDLGEQDAWAVAKQQFFYLSYQEEPNKALLLRYRQASAARLARFAPKDCDERRTPTSAAASRRRFQLGIVSAQVFDHSVFNAIVKGWLQRLNRTEFEITLFSVGMKHDTTTQAAGAAVEHFEADARSITEWAQLIRKRRLDALMFPEVGIDRVTLALASLRLAPRQFAAWGHPETTGLPTIDYYLSGDSFEPMDAVEHYSERLVRLPHLGVYYEPYRIAPTPVDLKRFEIPIDVPLFVCPGTPFKYRPEDDAVWVDIARRIGRCTFVFFTHDRVELSNKLHARMAAAFRRAGLDERRYLVFIPWLPRAEFLGVLRQADVYLDTLGFSGFNTLMQAVEAHLPSVAYEGRYLRGRLGSGILRRLELPELIAATRREYVEIAVKLAASAADREQLRDKLRLAEPRLYADAGAVDALAGLLRDS
jgi:protein O-GlcNAc transferase